MREVQFRKDLMILYKFQLGSTAYKSGLLQKHPQHGQYRGNTEGCFVNPGNCALIAQVALAAEEFKIIQLEEFRNLIHAALGGLPAGGSSQFTKFHLQASIFIC